MPRLASVRTVTLSLAVSAVLLIVVSLLSGGEAGAQQDDPRQVRIVIAGNPDQPNLSAVPPVKTICRNARAECVGEVQWRTSGRDLQATERIELVPKEGNDSCFESPTFTLTPEAPEVLSGPPTCESAFWDYDVVLYRDGSEIARLDPRIKIDP